MATSYQGRTDADLLAWANNFSTLITATPTAFGLTAAQATAYAGFFSGYSTAYTAVQNPATKTKVTVATKKAARAALLLNTSLLAKLVEGTASVTNAQKISLGLSIKNLPTPIPAPATAPMIDMVSAIGRTVQIRLHDSADTRKAKPVGVKSATVFSFVGAVPPISMTDWNYEGVSTRSVVNINFATTVANGALVWITAFWSNAKMQAGPLSDPISTNIPGGGVSMAA